MYLLRNSCIVLHSPLVVADFGLFSLNTFTGTDVAVCRRIQIRVSIDVIVGLKVGFQIHCNIKRKRSTSVESMPLARNL
jgi:hypothetical protein